MTRAACAADLVIVGQRDPDHPGDLSAPEDVILDCGRPILVVPSSGHAGRLETLAITAWNRSHEVTRAVRDALPIMEKLTGVAILSANPTAAGMDGGSSPDLAPHLARHGLKITAEVVDAENSAVADHLLSRAAALGAGLIVMGAYGHSRLRETILGGTTRAMLQNMTLPALMSH